MSVFDPNSIQQNPADWAALSPDNMALFQQVQNAGLLGVSNVPVSPAGQAPALLGLGSGMTTGAGSGVPTTTGSLLNNLLGSSLGGLLGASGALGAAGAAGGAIGSAGGGTATTASGGLTGINAYIQRGTLIFVGLVLLAGALMIVAMEQPTVQKAVKAAAT